MKKEYLQYIISAFWIIMGFSMLYVTYNEFQSWQETGFVKARREGLSLSGGGAISILIGYISLSLISFAAAYAFWRKKH